MSECTVECVADFRNFIKGNTYQAHVNSNDNNRTFQMKNPDGGWMQINADDFHAHFRGSFQKNATEPS